MTKPRILILGATGFVGGSVGSALQKAGFPLTLAVRKRSLSLEKFPKARIIDCDFIKDTAVSDWLPRLKNIDIIINCVGIFFHPNKDVIWAVHAKTPTAIFQAAEKQGVKKIIHLSALGIESYAAAYAESKQAAEKSLKETTVPHVILKPSFIYGPGSRGGLSLIRGLAAFPTIIPVAGKGNQLFQPIFIKDLTAAILNLVSENTDESYTLAAVSKDKISLKAIMTALRQWLHLKPGFFVKVPLPLIKLVAKLGNFFPNTSINTDAISMLEQDNVASEKEAKRFQLKTKVKPLDFQAGLSAMPSRTEDRWYAKLFFVPLILRLSLAFMWLFSGITSLFLYPLDASYSLLNQVGIGSEWQGLFLYGAASLNILIGLGLVLNYKTRFNCLIQILVILLYTVIISIKLPYLWLEPFGPIVKNIPILVAIWVLSSMESD